MSAEPQTERDEPRGGGLGGALALFLLTALAIGGFLLVRGGHLEGLFGPRLPAWDEASLPPPEQLEAPSAETERPAARKRRRQAQRTGAGSRTEADPDAAPPAAGAAEGQGTLLVHCSAPCRIRVDGTPRGTSPPAEPISLATGRHRLRVERTKGDEVHDKEILIAPSRVRQIKVRFSGADVVDDFFNDLTGTEEW